MSEMKDWAYRAECIGVCTICGEPTDEMRAPFIDLYGVSFPPCRECGEHAIYTVAEIIDNPKLQDRKTISALLDLDFPMPEKNPIVKIGN